MTRRTILAFALLAGSCLRLPAADTELENHIQLAMRQVYPSLLYIQPVTEDYSAGRRTRHLSSGSGVIYTADGLALTNYHVAGQAEFLVCTLSNKEKVEATLVGGDPWTDVAVIRLDPRRFKQAVGPDFHPAELGEAAAIRVGRQVLAMGSPFGYDRSVSLGIISCADRYLSEDLSLPTGEATGGYNTWIQTDAAINPGNSGGPLVDLTGRVIGLNARVIFMGNSIGFAIPVDTVREVAESLVKNGRMARSWLGLSLQPVGELERELGRTIGGVLISGVEADSPALRSGVAAGDVLEAVDGQSVKARFPSEIPELRRRLARLPVGGETKLTLRPLTGGEARTLTLKPAEKSEYLGRDYECPEWGVTVKSLTLEMIRKLRLPDDKGVLVFGVQEGSPAAAAGLQPFDAIVALDGAPIRDLPDFSKRYEDLIDRQAQRLGLTTRRGKSLSYLLLKPRYEPEEQ